MNRRDRERREEGRISARQWAEDQDQGFEPTAVRLPEGVEFFKQEDGANVLDFFSYKVTKGKDEGGNPRADAGFRHFETEYEVHRIPGTGKFANPYVCRKKRWGKRCAACDWLVKHGNTASEELVQQIRPQIRHLWIVNDKPGKARNKLKVFDSNHYNRGLGFGQQMGEAINAQLSEDDDFTDLKEGKKVCFNVDGKYRKVTRVDFKDRDYEYPKETLAHGIDLDECLIDPGYEEIKNLLEMGDSRAHEDDDRDEEPEDDGKDRDEGEDEEDEILRSKKKKPSKARDEDEPDKDNEDNDEEENDEDERPTKKKPTSTGEDDDEEDEADEEDEEDEDKKPAAKKTGKKKQPTAEDCGIDEGDMVKIITGNFLKKLKGKELEVVSISGDGTSLTLEDRDGEEHKGIGPEEVEKAEEDEDEEEEEDETPKKKGKSTSKSKASDDNDDEEDDDADQDDDNEDDSFEEDDEDEKPAAKKKVRR